MDFHFNQFGCDMSYTYKGESTVIPSVTGNFCPACGENVLDKIESARYENGKTRPPLALIKLLKVSDRHPDLLAEIRIG